MDSAEDKRESSARSQGVPFGAEYGEDGPVERHTVMKSSCARAGISQIACEHRGDAS